MTKTSLTLQDLRRRRDAKATAEPSWRFWGLYGPICPPETLQEASQLAQANNGAPGMDGVTCAAMEASGLDAFREQRRHALVTRTYRPRR
jgi:RNA-directed DNA polymerase